MPSSAFIPRILIWKTREHQLVLQPPAISEEHLQHCESSVTLVTEKLSVEWYKSICHHLGNNYHYWPFQWAHPRWTVTRRTVLSLSTYLSNRKANKVHLTKILFLTNVPFLLFLTCGTQGYTTLASLTHLKHLSVAQWPSARPDGGCSLREQAISANGNYCAGKELRSVAGIFQLLNAPSGTPTKPVGVQSQSALFQPTLHTLLLLQQKPHLL